MFSQIPLLWRGEVQHVAVVDRTLFPVLNTRKWHISNVRRPQAPRTSSSIGPKTIHLQLHRVVVVLSKFERAQQIEIWSDVKRLDSYCRQLPAVSFLDESPFRCTLDNLFFTHSRVACASTKVLFLDDWTLPKAAIEIVPSLHRLVKDEESKHEIPFIGISREELETMKPSQDLPSIREILNGRDVDKENENIVSDVLNCFNEDNDSSQPSE